MYNVHVCLVHVYMYIQMYMYMFLEKLFGVKSVYCARTCACTIHYGVHDRRVQVTPVHEQILDNAVLSLLAHVDAIVYVLYLIEEANSIAPQLNFKLCMSVFVISPFYDVKDHVCMYIHMYTHVYTCMLVLSCVGTCTISNALPLPELIDCTHIDKSFEE